MFIFVWGKTQWHGCQAREIWKLGFESAIHRGDSYVTCRLKTNRPKSADFKFSFCENLENPKKFGHVRFGIMGAEMAEISAKSCFLNFWCQIHILVKFQVSNCFSWKVTIKTPKTEVKWGFHWKIQKILKIDFSRNLG